MADDISSMTASGNSDRDEEFERLDEEFETWLHETSQKHVSIVDSDRISLKMNRNIDTDTDYQVRGTKSNSGQSLMANGLAVSQTTARSNNCKGCPNKDFSCPRTPVISPHQDAEASNLGHAPVHGYRTNRTHPNDELDQVEVDELSNLIDRMIQQLPQLSCHSS
jgi:hypothetical protein